MNPNEKFRPRPTPETQEYWDGARRGELRIQRCNACQRPYFYPRSSCPQCGGVDIEWMTATGRATLHSYGISMRPTPGFEAPYVIAIVELEEGPRMLSAIRGVAPQPENLELDMPLTVCFEDRGDYSIPAFSPTETIR
ncbi:OB-fold domain-containing protein [Microbacterium enclense]|uniref:Zn-ribbon domain-containing OB-fold protein n=1 Tax=Microbacterium enclense TaxID=993073 RepID=UPI0028830A17|nr:OB-fold domain-containing protein [Microbacterium enclense]